MKLESKIEQLKNLVYAGAIDKNLALTDAVLDRIGYELIVIEKQGFADYFILYSRIIEICNELNLLRSFGRGSAPSSLVNYCLDITKLNPIAENLVFERFVVHPEQNYLPDIDIDIPKGYQEKVIEKLKQKYPLYNAYFIAYSSQSDAVYKDVFYNNINYKKHPCGIIITPEKITHSIFQYEEQDYYLASDPFDDSIFKNKIDLLELEYLNRLQLIVNEIGEIYHPYKIPLDDKQVFEYFASGDLEDIFHFKTPSLAKIVSQFQPDSIYDLAIVLALFRPGTLNCIPEVIRNKFNPKERLCYNDNRVSKILDETYGQLVYQETFLHLSKEIAGIPFAEAELWRKRIMKDKFNIESIAFSSIFIKGCREHSTLNEIEISSLIKMISKLLPIIFNKPHSLCYSIIGYWGAYYKTHFRTPFDRAFSCDVRF